LSTLLAFSGVPPGTPSRTGTGICGIPSSALVASVVGEPYVPSGPSSPFVLFLLLLLLLFFLLSAARFY
jgi:hypothetical protein